MRSYFIDELNPTEIQRLASHLAAAGLQGTVRDIYWLTLPEDLLTPEQCQHLEHCGPFVASIELGDAWMKIELLIRGRGKLRCSCIGLATPEQRDWVLDQIDVMLRDLEITV